MHELGYTKDIVTRVLAASELSGASAVRAVYLTIGEVRDIVDDLLRQCFHWLARDTIASDAEVVIDRVPFEVRCRRCGATYSFDPYSKADNSCPACSAQDFEVVSGLEFGIDHIEVV